MYLVFACIAVFVLAAWLYRRTVPIVNSAILNYILYEPVEIEAEVLTLATKAGNAIRYVLYLVDGFYSHVQTRIRERKRVRRFRGLRSRKKLWQKARVFPSLEQWRRERWWRNQVPQYSSGVYRPPYPHVKLLGSMKLPTRVYVNSSCIVELSLYPEHTGHEHAEPRFSLEQRGDETVIVSVWNEEWRDLEIRLVGIGIDIVPIDSEVQSGSAMHFSWGCTFRHSGIQTLALRTRVRFHMGWNSYGLNHTVRVVQLDHLTTRQIRILAGVLGFISTAIGVAVGLDSLGFY